MGVPSYEELFNEQGLGQGGFPGSTPGLGGGGWNDAVASRSNSLTSMGLGMMGGGWLGGMQGYGQGSKVDEQAASRQQQARQHAADKAQAQANADRAYALQSAPQVVHVKGLLGDELMLRDPLSGKLTPYSPGGAAPGGASGGAPAGNYDEQGNDQGYLNAVSQKYGQDVANSVKAMAEGRLPAGGFGSLKQLIPLATTYKQGFNAADYLVHLQAEKSFQPGGKNFDKVRAFNQAAKHGNAAWDINEQLGGINVGGTVGGVLNRGYSEYQGMTDPKYVNNLAKYDELTTFLSNELIAASKGGNASDVRAAHEASARLRADRSSPEARRGAIQGAFLFLEGAHNALETTGRSAGRRSGFQMQPLIEPENQAVYDKIIGYKPGQSTAPAASGQASPATSAGTAQAAPAESIPPASQRQVGQTYPTPKGPLKWTGTGWVSP